MGLSCPCSIGVSVFIACLVWYASGSSCRLHTASLPNQPRYICSWIYPDKVPIYLYSVRYIWIKPNARDMHVICTWLCDMFVQRQSWRIPIQSWYVQRKSRIHVCCADDHCESPIEAYKDVAPVFMLLMSIHFSLATNWLIWMSWTWTFYGHWTTQNLRYIYICLYMWLEIDGWTYVYWHPFISLATMLHQICFHLCVVAEARGGETQQTDHWFGNIWSFLLRRRLYTTLRFSPFISVSCIRHLGM